MPKRMEWHFFSRIGASKQRLRHDRETAAHSGEAANLGKTSEFNRAITPAFDLKNRMRDLRIRNVSLVSGVEQNQRIVLARIVDPAG